MTNKSRRDFFKKTASFFPAFIGMGVILNSCDSGIENSKSNESKNEKKSGTSCDDLSGLSDDDLATRKKLNYVEVSTVQSKTCKLCALFIPSKEGSECGTCSLIKGPIKPSGSCVYWAKIESGSGA